MISFLYAIQGILVLLILHLSPINAMKTLKSRSVPITQRLIGSPAKRAILTSKYPQAWSRRSKQLYTAQTSPTRKQWNIGKKFFFSAKQPIRSFSHPQQKYLDLELRLAIRHHDSPTKVQELLKKGADPNAVARLWGKSPDTVSILIHRPLGIAIQETNNPAIAQILINAGANPTEIDRWFGNTYLHIWAQAAMQHFLTGEKENSRDIFYILTPHIHIDTQNKHGETPLHIIVKNLIQLTPIQLHFVGKFLLPAIFSVYPNPFIKDNNGNTPLDIMKENTLYTTKYSKSYGLALEHSRILDILSNYQRRYNQPIEVKEMNNIKDQ